MSRDRRKSNLGVLGAIIALATASLGCGAGKDSEEATMSVSGEVQGLAFKAIPGAFNREGDDSWAIAVPDTDGQRARGRLKADIDLLIAATAIAEGAVLVTDDADLLGGDIPGLAVENWA